jgi:hypothetical protein
VAMQQHKKTKPAEAVSVISPLQLLLCGGCLSLYVGGEGPVSVVGGMLGVLAARGGLNPVVEVPMMVSMVAMARQGIFDAVVVGDDVCPHASHASLPLNNCGLQPTGQLHTVVRLSQLDSSWGG